VVFLLFEDGGNLIVVGFAEAYLRNRVHLGVHTTLTKKKIRLLAAGGKSFNDEAVIWT
jgi:hypothetical protein